MHLDAPAQWHGQQPVSRTADPGVVKQDKSSRGSVDTTKTRSDPHRVRMSSGKRPIVTAKGKQPNTEALCQTAPLAPAQACPSTEWALNRCVQDFLGPLFFVALIAGLVCDTLVEGKRGSFMSVVVHYVHTNIVPHIATPCLSVWM